MTDIPADSGSAIDIQTAVNQVVAAGGIGTVYIPAGTFDFVVDPSNLGPVNKAYGVLIPGGVNVIGQGKDVTVLRESVDPPIGTPMFLVDGRNGLQTRISGIGFVGYVLDTEDTAPIGLHFLGAADYRADHCSFTDFTGTALHLSNNYIPYGANRGLIDNCEFDNPYKGTDGTEAGGALFEPCIWGYGIGPYGTGSNWDALVDLLGKYEGTENLVYVEDCTFSRTREAIATSGGPFYCARYNIFNGSIPRNFHQLDVHGSARGLEAYNNMIIGRQYPPTLGNGWVGIGVGMRGGGGVIYDNTIIDSIYGIVLNNDMVDDTTRIKDLYIWNNSHEKDEMPAEDPITYIQNVDPGEIREDIEYFLYERPGYEPYTYPHPLQGVLRTPLGRKSGKRKTKLF